MKPRIVYYAITAALIAFVSYAAAAQGYGSTGPKPCLHGESSTIVAVQAGRVVTVQPPVYTGCRP